MKKTKPQNQLRGSQVHLQDPKRLIKKLLLDKGDARSKVTYSSQSLLLGQKNPSQKQLNALLQSDDSQNIIQIGRRNLPKPSTVLGNSESQNFSVSSLQAHDLQKKKSLTRISKNLLNLKKVNFSVERLLPLNEDSDSCHKPALQLSGIRYDAYQSVSVSKTQKNKDSGSLVRIPSSHKIIEEEPKRVETNKHQKKLLSFSSQKSPKALLSQLNQRKFNILNASQVETNPKLSQLIQQQSLKSNEHRNSVKQIQNSLKHKSSFKELRFEDPKQQQSQQVQPQTQKSNRSGQQKIVLKKSCLKNRQSNFSYSNFIQRGSTNQSVNEYQAYQKEMNDENLNQNLTDQSLNQSRTSIYNITFSSFKQTATGGGGGNTVTGTQESNCSQVTFPQNPLKKPQIQKVQQVQDKTQSVDNLNSISIVGQGTNIKVLENLKIRGQKCESNSSFDRRQKSDFKIRPNNSAVRKKITKFEEDYYDVSTSFIKQDPHENLDTEYANDDESNQLTLEKKRIALQNKHSNSQFSGKDSAIIPSPQFNTPYQTNQKVLQKTSTEEKVDKTIKSQSFNGITTIKDYFDQMVPSLNQQKPPQKNTRSIMSGKKMSVQHTELENYDGPDRPFSMGMKKRNSCSNSALKRMRPISCSSSTGNTKLPACFTESVYQNSEQKRQQSAQMRIRKAQSSSQQNEQQSTTATFFNNRPQSNTFANLMAASRNSCQNSIRSSSPFEQIQKPLSNSIQQSPKKHQQDEDLGPLQKSQPPPIPKVPQRRIQSSNQKHRKPVTSKKIFEVAPKLNQKLESHFQKKEEKTEENFQTYLEETFQPVALNQSQSSQQKEQQNNQDQNQINSFLTNSMLENTFAK